jgi:predicted negative regulator of RcsB-dependent stress response
LRVSDFLSEEEQLARLRGWWQRYGAAVVLGALLVVAGVLGWRWYQSYTAERLAEASDLYVAFQAAEGDAREALARQILEGGRGTAYPAFVLFEQAEAAVTAGDRAGAEPLLRQAIQAAPAVELADTARLRLARVLVDLERLDDALGVLGQVRGAGYLALAAEMQGDIHLFSGNRTLAHASYTAATTHLPAGEQRPVLEMKIADTADASDS